MFGFTFFVSSKIYDEEVYGKYLRVAPSTYLCVYTDTRKALVRFLNKHYPDWACLGYIKYERVPEWAGVYYDVCI